jgi:hypothetical protein
VLATRPYSSEKAALADVLFGPAATFALYTTDASCTQPWVSTPEQRVLCGGRLRNEFERGPLPAVLVVNFDQFLQEDKVDLQDFNTPDGLLHYRLVAFTVLKDGHYYAYVKDRDQWWEYAFNYLVKVGDPTTVLFENSKNAADQGKMLCLGVWVR